MKCVGGFAFAFIMEKELHSSLRPVLANYCTFQYKNTICIWMAVVKGRSTSHLLNLFS